MIILTFLGIYGLFAVLIFLRMFGCACRTFLRGSGLHSGPIEQPLWMKNVFFHYETEAGTKFTLPIRLGTAFVSAVGETVTAVITALIYPLYFVIWIGYLIDRVYNYSTKREKKIKAQKGEWEADEIALFYIIVGALPEKFVDVLADTQSKTRTIIDKKLQNRIQQLDEDDLKVLREKKLLTVLQKLKKKLT